METATGTIEQRVKARAVISISVQAKLISTLHTIDCYCGGREFCHGMSCVPAQDPTRSRNTASLVVIAWWVQKRDMRPRAMTTRNTVVYA
jgi:hypothetical protein